MTRRLIAACFISMLPLAAWAGMDDLPGIPLDVVETSEQPAPMTNITLTPKFSSENTLAAGMAGGYAAAPQYEEKEKVDKSLYESTRVGLNVIPGENMILPISVGNPNRLITPFDNPRVTTASDAQISVDHSIVYVTPASEDLVTMFVTEMDGDQKNAVSLTMVPRKIPPREVRLLVSEKGEGGENSADPGMMSGFNNVKATEWEKGQEYTDTIRDTMRELALGKTPPGYGIRAYRPIIDPKPLCNVPGFAVEPGQTLDGHNMIVVVSKITNSSNVPLEFKSSSCYQPTVLAAAAWPKTLLAPGQSSELYLLTKRPDPSENSGKRPSLLGGQ